MCYWDNIPNPVVGLKRPAKFNLLPCVIFLPCEDHTAHACKNGNPAVFRFWYISYNRLKNRLPKIPDQIIVRGLNPVYANNPDSARFQVGEQENTAFALFSKENNQKLQKLGVLQNFLMNYDDTKSKFYKQGIEEYEKRRQNYNQWLNRRTVQDSTLFASRLYRFNYVPQIPWKGSEKDREQSVLQHFFDGIDFNDPVITRTAQINDWMNAYVNMHMKLITNGN